MKPVEVMVKILLGVIILFLIVITVSVLSSAGVQTHIVILWACTLLLFGLSAASVLDLLPKEWGGKLFVAALILIGLTIILQTRVIPFCGDGVCGSGECNRCAKDCRPNDCADGICQPRVESCANSDDCACYSQACAPGRNGSDTKGCFPVKCGDGFCDAPEGPQSCCQDCGCVGGYKCERNICFFELPVVSFTTYQLTPTISAGSLAGNPLLTDQSGSPRPLMTLLLRTTKSIENVTVTYSIPGVLSNEVFVGTIYSEQEIPVPWHIVPDSRLLNITEDVRTNISVVVRYIDGARNKDDLNRSFPITLLSANTLDQFGHIVLFTQEVDTAATTPEGIWDELRTMVRLEHREGTRMQFPQQTLARGVGAPRDIAVLLASAYNTAGLRTFIVESPDGYFVRVWNNDRYVILDPALFDGNFNSAISFKPGYAVYNINQTFVARNFTRIT